MIKLPNQRIDLNGIRARGGEYALSLDPGRLKDLALGRRLDQQALSELQRKTRGASRGIEEDLRDLSRAGWGVILPAALDDRVLRARLDALSELLTHRQSAAGARYTIFSGRRGYISGESKRDWLLRAGASPDGSPNPDRVPYYLLIAASPEEIPYAFQYQLDVQYLTGRVYFDRLDEYANYARSVVQVEKNGLLLPRRAAIFAPANPDDSATRLSHDRLAVPLDNYLQKRLRSRMFKDMLERLMVQKGIRFSLEAHAYTEPELLQVIEKLKLPLTAADIPHWETQAALGSQATRARLEDFLNGPEAPALLFSASHGMVFDAGDPLQRLHQGALLCQDWQGPLFHHGDVTESLYFAGDHLNSSAHILGMVAFFFACYGAGTPKYDEFILDQQRPLQIAGQNFLAALPQRMLAHPNGGALAVVGHVDRTWSYSFLADNNQTQTNVFEDMFGKLLSGFPIGYAMDAFNRRYAELATEITDIQNKARIPGYMLDEYLLSDLWITHNDARNYIIIGDPAVTLPAAARPQGERTLTPDANLLAGGSDAALGQPAQTLADDRAGVQARAAFAVALAQYLDQARSQAQNAADGSARLTVEMAGPLPGATAVRLVVTLPDGSRFEIVLDESSELLRLYRAMPLGNDQGLTG